MVGCGWHKLLEGSRRQSADVRVDDYRLGEGQKSTGVRRQSPCALHKPVWVLSTIAVNVGKGSCPRTSRFSSAYTQCG